MKHNRTLLQGDRWQININLRYGVPGYLFVTSMGAATDSFAALPPKAFPELGRFLGLACGAVEAVLGPEKVLSGKFGIVPGLASLSGGSRLPRFAISESQGLSGGP